MIPRRRKREKFGTHDNGGPLRCRAHLQHVRGFACSVQNEDCKGSIEAAHVRYGAHAGMAQKPGDDRVIPLCHAHHAEQHRIGEAAFERRYGISMIEIANRLAAMSPALRKLRNADPR